MAKFNAMDRCDQCSAQAWVSVTKSLKDVAGVSELLFCAHHFEKNDVILYAEGWTIERDNRESMNTKPSQSSA